MWCQRMPQEIWCRSVSCAVLYFADVAALLRTARAKRLHPAEANLGYYFKGTVRQKAMMDLAVQFDNASAAKHDLRQAYEKCNDIPQETRTLIDTFLKQESDEDYEMNLAMYRKAAKIEKQIETKYDEDVLRETLKEQARAEKEWEDIIKKEEAERELFISEFGVQSDSEYETD
ncbi:hypothetical protein Tco_0727507 [Tanacetum coccineum]|uniref:Uncharacterized protein n=1 Tax=Tanacetum coccineum TaxID=301880 RepID=A0ABQ4YKV9_9ASTR